MRLPSLHRRGETGVPGDHDWPPRPVTGGQGRQASRTNEDMLTEAEALSRYFGQVEAQTAAIIDMLP